MPEALKKLSRVLALTMACAFLASFASSSKNRDINPLSVLGEGSDMYFYVPVNDNMELVETLMSSVVGIAENDAHLLASRIDSLYLGMGKTAGESINVYAEGSFPSIGQSIALTEKNGWKKTSYTPQDSSLKIEYFYSDFGFNVAFPTTKNMMVSNDIIPMLDNFHSSYSVEPECGQWFNGHEHVEDAILFYVVEPGEFMKKIVGSIAEKWCDNVYGEIKKDKGTSSYSVSCCLELSNPKTQKSLGTLIKTLTGMEVSFIDDNIIRIDDWKLSAQDVIRFMY
ncbi:MAG: hypothetical protein J6S91_06125 [Treponema sp.]|nr:hypothetical protein [Treponema sp.]